MPRELKQNAVRLRLFANRENQEMTYEWLIVGAPVNSSAAVQNANGSVSESSPFEYRYREGEHPTFTPDVPGEYTLQLHVKTVFEDQVSKEVGVRAVYQTQVMVDGPAVETSGGLLRFVGQHKIALVTASDKRSYDVEDAGEVHVQLVAHAKERRFGVELVPHLQLLERREVVQ